MKLKARRNLNPDGSLKSIHLSWRDAQFFEPGPGLFNIFAATIGIMGVITVITWWAYMSTGNPQSLKYALMGLSIPVGARVLYWWLKRQKYRYRGFTINADGRMHFTHHLPEHKRRKLQGTNVEHLTGIEYGQTVQWTNLSPRYNLKVRGGWWDVYATLKSGRRLVLARNCWDRNANHHLALTLGEAVREVQNLIKVTESNARVHAAGPVAGPRSGRVID